MLKHRNDDGKGDGSKSDQPSFRSESQSHADKPICFVRIRGLASMAAEYREGDGLNPREEKRQRTKKQQGAKCNHSAERLASQILEALCLSSLLAELGLDAFAFVKVQPAQQSGCYMVELRCREAGIAFDSKEIEQRLRSARGRFRTEVSAFVHRRKAPNLQFRVIPAE